MLPEAVEVSAEQTINENKDKILFIIFLTENSDNDDKKLVHACFFVYYNDVKRKLICRREGIVSVSTILSQFIVLREENNFSRLLLLLWNQMTEE